MSVHFHALRVAEIVPETTEANSIRFEIPPELRDEFAFKAGQHLTLRATINGEEVRRNYSLCTAPADSDDQAECVHSEEGRSDSGRIGRIGNYDLF